MLNPNPQPVAIAAYESPKFTITMSRNGSIAGNTYQLNIRDRAGNAIYQVAGTVSDAGSVATPGIVTVTLTSAQIGAMKLKDYDYDLWRTDAGGEKRLVWGKLAVGPQQWK